MKYFKWLFGKKNDDDDDDDDYDDDDDDAGSTSRLRLAIALRRLSPTSLSYVEQTAEDGNTWTQAMICNSELEAIMFLWGAVGRIKKELKQEMDPHNLDLWGKPIRTYNVFYYDDHIKCGTSGSGYEDGIIVYKINKTRRILGLKINYSKYAVVSESDRFD